MNFSYFSSEELLTFHFYDSLLSSCVVLSVVVTLLYGAEIQMRFYDQSLSNLQVVYVEFITVHLVLIFPS